MTAKKIDMRFRLFIRLLLIAIAIVGTGYFAYQYINPSGQISVEYDFCRAETPYFSGLSPNGRVLDLDRQQCRQRMVIDPVYFDVRLPQSYRTVKINLLAEMPDNQPLAIGVGIDPENWQWEFAQDLGGNQYLIDLSQAKFENNRYRFIVSTPGLDVSGQEILFEKIELDFTKEPLTRGNFKQRLNSILN